MKIIHELKNTHPAIYKRIIELQIANGNNPNDSLKVGDDSSMGNFWWSSTEEGFDVWADVDEGRFDSWYDHHKLKPKTIVVTEPRTIMSKSIAALPSLLRIAGICFVALNVKEIMTENTLIWIPGLMIFGLAEFIDLFKKIYYEQNR
jgi:hypothetical protein